MTSPWARLPEETEPAWLAWTAYRDMEQRPRSLSALAQQQVGEKTGKGRVRGTARTRQRHLEQWSAKHSWQARAAAFDDWVDRQAVAAFVAEHESERRRLVSAASALNRRMLAGLASKDPASMSPRDLFDGWTRTLAIITKLRGLDELRIVAAPGGPGGLSVDELAAREQDRQERLAEIAALREEIAALDDD